MHDNRRDALIELSASAVQESNYADSTSSLLHTAKEHSLQIYVQTLWSSAVQAISFPVVFEHIRLDQHTVLIQEEMLGSVRESGGGEWSVLVMDEITTRVMSSSCRISDVLDYGVSCTVSSSAESSRTCQQHLLESLY